MRRIVTGISLLMLTACSSIFPPGLDDLCRDARNCAPRCGSVATGASPACSPAENEGRTRG